MFRVEAKGSFLRKRDLFPNEARSRMSLLRGDLYSKDQVTLVSPHGDDDLQIEFRQPGVLLLSSSDTLRTDAYYPQPLLQYQEAVQKLRHGAYVTTGQFNSEFVVVYHTESLVVQGVHPSSFSVRITSFRILSNESSCMVRDGPPNVNLHPDQARRVDITKPLQSSQCRHPIYLPLNENPLPDGFEDTPPAWFLHLPRRLLEAMRDCQVSSLLFFELKSI